MRSVKQKWVWGFFCLGFILLGACVSGGDSGGGGDGSTESSGSGEFSSGDCDGFCGTESIDVNVNLAGAQALFTVSQETGSVDSALIKTLNAKGMTISTSSPLFAVTDEGLQGILTALDPEGNSAIADLPRLSFVAVSPIREVFLAFEHPFIYRESYTNSSGDEITMDQYSDPWSPSSPFTCQLFVVDELIGQASTVSAEEMNLTCVKNDIEINTWDARTKRIQFDANGNAYFAGHIPGNWKDVLFKYETNKTALASLVKTDTIDTTQLSEVINANICFERFLVTNAGGVLYTGRTSTDSSCNGDSFFRYIEPDNTLHQITTGWWDFTFAPIEEPLAGGSEADDFFQGQILFYGPDPLSALSNGWDTACLFRFDSEASGVDRSTQIADCDNDIWYYIEFDADGNNNTQDVRQQRCEEAKTMMGGGNVPEKIMLANTVDDADDLNEVLVVGQVYEKAASEWRCNLCTDGVPGNYCVLGDDLRFDATTVGACTAIGGTFSNDQGCFNDQEDSATTGNVCDEDALPANWNINGEWCEFNGNNALETRSALARVDENYDGEGANRIVRLSDDDEIVENGWAIGDRLAYSSFNATSGEYELREVGSADVLISGIEVYELMQDPRDATHWFFNGLRFSDNQYIFGSFDPNDEDPESTLTVEEGITGQVDTLVIVPSL